MSTLSSRLLVVCLLACTGVLGGGLLAGATAAAADGGLLRLAHLSPDTPAVDVVIAGPAPAADGATAFDGVSYGDVSPYVELPAGRYTVAVRRAGAPTDTPAVLSSTIDLTAGSAHTLTVSRPFADLGLAEVDDDLSAPPPGEGRIRVLDGTSGDVVVRLPDGTELSGAVTVPAGRIPVLVSSTDGRTTEVPLDVAGGSVQSLLVLDDADGDLRVRPVIDAAGPAEPPVGGVDAGGGPAPRPTLPHVVAGLLESVQAAAAQAAVAERAARVPAPVRVRMPALGLDAPLVAVRTRDDGVLAPPDSAAAGGWFAGGPRPGEIGPAVLTGHVDWAGRPGSFARLAQARPGAEILVERTDGTAVRFTVTSVTRSAKADFPTGAVYGPAARAELRLITCGGEFDRATGSYRDNVVVYATAVWERGPGAGV